MRPFFGLLCDIAVDHDRIGKNVMDPHFLRGNSTLGTFKPLQNLIFLEFPVLFLQFEGGNGVTPTAVSASHAPHIIIMVHYPWHPIIF